MKWTYAQITELTPRLKNHLCAIYNFIHLHKDSTNPKLKDIDFTVEGVSLAKRILDKSNTSDIVMEKFVTNFLDSLVAIETMAMIQPSAKIFFYKEVETEVNGATEVVELGEEVILNDFDLEEMKYKIGIYTRRYPKLNLIYKNYIPADIEIF